MAPPFFVNRQSPIPARERCAHSQALCAPERLESLWVTEGRGEGELRVYGHRGGALPIGAGMP